MEKIDSNIYFTGIPSPGAAGLSLLPVFIVFEFEILFLRDPYLNVVNLFVIGFLMISKVPTISLKNIYFNKKYSPWIFLLIAALCIGIISNVWMTLVILGCVYIISILFTVIKNIKSKN